MQLNCTVVVVPARDAVGSFARVVRSLAVTDAPHCRQRPLRNHRVLTVPYPDRQCYLEGGFGSSSGWAHPTIDRQEVLSAEPEIALVRDHAGRIALHYVCTYNGSKHQGRQLYAGAPVEATRIVRAHVARCTTSRAASPSRDVPEHSIAKSVRVRVCVGAVCVSARAHA